MATHDKSGIYVIRQIGSERFYIGSSRAIYARWREHRRLLRVGKHHSRYLQLAWSKHGEAAFDFSILEGCGLAELLEREQWYLDAFKPQFNNCPLARSRRGSKQPPGHSERQRAYAAAKFGAMTHCPHGHEYTPENTYKTRRSKHICRTCTYLRNKQAFLSESPEQRSVRLARMARLSAQPHYVEKRRKYMAEHKAEKAAYDRARRQRLKESA